MLTATYSPEDNKLRLYSSHRLDMDLYKEVRAQGFIYAPKQQLFVAPAWTPGRAAFLEKLCGDIDHEQTTLAERAEMRAERFGIYTEKRTADAESAAAAVEGIAGNIPMGQPILVGHHSEKRARKDQERIENNMRKAVKNWETAEYWKDRAQGVIHHATRKDKPGVRIRRIKTLGADMRRCERSLNQALERKCEQSTIAHYEKWVNHLKMRIDYENAILAGQGHTMPDFKAIAQARRAKTTAAPIINTPEPFETYNRYHREIYPASKPVEITKEQWSKCPSDYRGVSPHPKGYRYRTISDRFIGAEGWGYSHVYIKDQKRVDVPTTSEASNAG
jgi:hypothetical protein